MSSIRRDSMLPTTLSAYVRCMSPANILGSQFDKQFGRSFMQDKNNSAPRMVPAPLPLRYTAVS